MIIRDKKEWSAGLIIMVSDQPGNWSTWWVYLLIIFLVDYSPVDHLPADHYLVDHSRSHSRSITFLLITLSTDDTIIWSVDQMTRSLDQMTQSLDWVPNSKILPNSKIFASGGEKWKKSDLRTPKILKIF